MPSRMLKKAGLLTRPTLARQDAPCPEQGRGEQRGEEVRTVLRVGRSPFELILANGKVPPVIPTSERLCSVHRASERCENAAGGLFQHSARAVRGRSSRQ